MASASPGKENDLTVCAICLEQFNNPKYLPCLHTFCEACLSKYITSASGKSINTKPGFLCPTCRIFTEIKSTGDNFHSFRPRLALTLPNTGASSAAFLPNGCVVLTHYFDKKVTLIDVNGNCLSSLSLPCHPWDVTLVTPQLAVATLPYKKQLVYINIDQSTLTVYNTMTLDGECRGVCRVDQTLLVTYPTRLNVLDLQGNMLDTIRVSGYKRLLYIATHQDRIYLSNNSKHCVLIIDKQGKEISRYTSDKLTHPWKITADCEGNIYVVGYSSQNIHQLTSDGNLIRILPVDINGPTCVVFDENSNRFLVSSCSNMKTMIYTMV